MLSHYQPSIVNLGTLIEEYSFSKLVSSFGKIILYTVVANSTCRGLKTAAGSSTSPPAAGALLSTSPSAGVSSDTPSATGDSLDTPPATGGALVTPPAAEGALDTPPAASPDVLDTEMIATIPHDVEMAVFASTKARMIAMTAPQKPITHADLIAKFESRRIRAINRDNTDQLLI